MSPTPRALRVGVLLGNHLVEERVFRSSHLAPITFGQSLKCTLSIPAAGVPSEHTLFAVDQGRILLRVTAEMTGRLAQGDEIDSDLRRGAGEGGVWTIPLSHGARGKLHIGEATVLFQEIAALPIAPRPQLPASVRGTFADRIDRRLATIVSVSLLAHLGIASWAWMTERVGADAEAEAVAAYEPPTYDVIDIVAPDIDPTPANPSEPGVAAPVSPKQTPTPIVPRQNVDRLPEPFDADRWANAITGNEVGKTGQTEIPKRVPRTDLDKQIQQIKDGQNVKVGNAPTSRDRDPRLGDGPDGPRIGDPKLDQIAKQEKKPVTRITPVPMPKRPGKDPLPIALVLGRIQSSYMAGLQRCYVKHGLAHDASLVAKVTITFTVDETGRSTDNVARGANPDVDGCIRDQMASWRFQVPKDDDGDPTDAPFKLQLALQPS